MTSGALPSRRPRVYLIRHGEADWNVEGRLLSFTDQPLSAAGERQAAELAAALSGITWDRAYSSPRIRARRTAELVLAGGQDPPDLVIDERLVEMDFGPYEGWSEADLAADPLAVTRRRDNVEIPGVEPEATVASRATSFFADLAGVTGTTLVVAHGRFLRILIVAAVLGAPPSLSTQLRMRNCRPAVVEPGVKPLLLGFNVGDPTNETG
jgi:broad specificity phosphatase PhoE